MDGPAFWMAAVVAAALVGASKGGLPVVGMLGVPVLALTISPVAAAGLLLPVFVLSDMFGLYVYRRAFRPARVVDPDPGNDAGGRAGLGDGEPRVGAAGRRAGRGDRCQLCRLCAVAAKCDRQHAGRGGWQARSGAR